MRKHFIGTFEIFVNGEVEVGKFVWSDGIDYFTKRRRKAIIVGRVLSIEGEKVFVNFYSHAVAAEVKNGPDC